MLEFELHRLDDRAHGRRPAAQKPQSGGTLNIVAASGPDHIDTVPAYYTADYELERVYTRQLVSYPTMPAATTASAAWTTDTTPVADAATEVPTAANGGITGGGTVYTFHIKPGVDWNTTPARQVTVRGLPARVQGVLQPGQPGRQPGVLHQHDQGPARRTTPRRPRTSRTPRRTRRRRRTSPPSRTRTPSPASRPPNSSTIQFTLTAAGQRLHLHAGDAVRVGPPGRVRQLRAELDSSWTSNSISDGPYQISSYIAGKSITFVQQPGLAAVHRHPAARLPRPRSCETLGVTSAQTQLADIQAGAQDLTNDTGVNPSSVPGLAASKASNFNIWPWSNTFPYMIFNLRSPNPGGAMQQPATCARRSSTASTRSRCIKAMGGPLVGNVHQHGHPAGQRRLRELQPVPGRQRRRAT